MRSIALPGWKQERLQRRRDARFHRLRFGVLPAEIGNSSGPRSLLRRRGIGPRSPPLATAARNPAPMVAPISAPICAPISVQISEL